MLCDTRVSCRKRLFLCLISLSFWRNACFLQAHSGPHSNCTVLVQYIWVTRFISGIFTSTVAAVIGYSVNGPHNFWIARSLIPRRLLYCSKIVSGRDTALSPRPGSPRATSSEPDRPHVHKKKRSPSFIGLFYIHSKVLDFSTNSTLKLFSFDHNHYRSFSIGLIPKLIIGCQNTTRYIELYT